MKQDGYLLTHILTHNRAWKIELRRASARRARKEGGREGIYKLVYVYGCPHKNDITELKQG